MKNKRQPLKHDLDGQTFGLLQVIGPVDEIDFYGNKLYECRCMICKKTVKYTRRVLVRGERKTCGDYKCKTTAMGYALKAQIKYPGKSDCNCYASEHACSALEEMMCRTRGYCKFYKSREK